MAQQSQEKKYPPQHQEQQPGKEHEMQPRPKGQAQEYRGCNKLQDKVALITGADSGIGRATAVAFAKEGANISIVYLNEHKDAEETRKLIEREGRRCLLISGDAGDEYFCSEAVKKTIHEFGKLDILVNNAAVQFYQEGIENISKEQLETTFRTNIFSYFFMTKAALKHLGKDSTIINTTSVTAYRGSPNLLDYSSTKGAIVSFTRSLALSLVKQGIRVNGVAPGPVWTPLIPAGFPEKKVETFGSQVPMQRAAEPDEISPCYVFLASRDSAYITGQVLHPNGGEMVGG
jgi:NAD(P)-dependent dehydrogenase (short-subunit alcohol dehydrogenase family)